MMEADLPEDVESCHALIRRLRDELQETRRKLSVHVENERRRYESLYGTGTTPQSLLAFGELIASRERSTSESDRRAIEAEAEALPSALAAEDAMPKGSPRRKRPPRGRK
jgi:hypothetical protein